MIVLKHYQKTLGGGRSSNLIYTASVPENIFMTTNVCSMVGIFQWHISCAAKNFMHSFF